MESQLADAHSKGRDELNGKDITILELNQKLERLSKDLKLKEIESEGFAGQQKQLHEELS